MLDTVCEGGASLGRSWTRNIYVRVHFVPVSMKEDFQYMTMLAKSCEERMFMRCNITVISIK